MKTFLHVGIHKTASTFMQEEFFRNLQGVTYCHCRSQCPEFLAYVLHTDDFEFQRDQARELFNAGTAVDGSAPVVLSDEMIYAPLTWNGYAHRRRGCDRFAEIFPNSHIAIVLRNQRQLLESHYREFIKNGGTSPWDRFLRNQVAPGYLHYGPYISYLVERLGDDNVSVFLYEDFVSAPEDYLNAWCDMLGVSRNGWDRHIAAIRSNPGISPHLLVFLRIANRFVANRRHPELILPRSLHVLLRGVLRRCSGWITGSSTRLCPETAVLQELLEGCRPGNRELSRYLGRDLGVMGYPC